MVALFCALIGWSSTGLAAAPAPEVYAIVEAADIYTNPTLQNEIGQIAGVSLLKL